jgi:N,N'-diacetyllegionaminate synthase
MKTLVIAEAGVNHNGDPALALKLVEVAARASANLVKFQTFRADAIATATAGKADYQIEATGAAHSQRELLRQLELSHDMHLRLIAHCKAMGIGFLSTGFDIEDVTMLAGLGQTLFKIPSGEITNRPLLEHVGRLGHPVILSTGMATLGEVEAALAVLEAAGTPRARITVLHCTTDYPTAMPDVNLRAMRSMARAFGVAVGYSDHTLGTEVALAAVALGASVIEKHFTLDRKLPGPDHGASLEPDELAAMVRGIRHLEAALGDGVKRPTPAELRHAALVRRSIVARKTIRRGEIFSAENLDVKRPGTGLSPMRWGEVIGRTAARDFAPDELIEL